MPGAPHVDAFRCEYRVNPEGIDIPNPRLGWIIESERRGEIQTACQVLVASTASLLADDQGDLWNSGRIPSNQSALVDYAGQPLASRANCFWKVRIWDRDGKVSKWSDPASWTMGLLGSNDWNAQWISDPVLADPANRPLTPIHCYRSELASRPDAAKWILLDLGSAKRMDAIEIIPARPKDQNGDFRSAMLPLRFSVKAATDHDFKDAQQVVDQTGADFPDPRPGSARFSFPPVTARYVRLAVTRLSRWDAQDYGLALGALNVFDGKQSIALGAPVECSDSIESELWSKRFLTDGHAAGGNCRRFTRPGCRICRTCRKNPPCRCACPMLRREFDLTGNVAAGHFICLRQGVLRSAD